MSREWASNVAHQQGCKRTSFSPNNQGGFCDCGAIQKAWSKACLANPAKSAGEPSPDPSPASGSPLAGLLSKSEKEIADALDQAIAKATARYIGDRLIQQMQAQTKALEEYTKATANLTIHIGLLIQAMADSQDEDGAGPDLRTLG